MSSEPRALGKPYDASRDQPLPGLPEPPPAAEPAVKPASAGSAADDWPLPGEGGKRAPDAEPAAGDSLAERLAAVDAEPAASRAPARIDVTNEAEARRNLRRALVARALPDVYARRGELVEITEVAGLAVGELPYVSAATIDPHALRRLVGTHTWTYKLRPESRKVDAKLVEVEAVPTVPTCRDLLSEHSWPGLQPLRGVTLVPILRPDGTLVQTRGYDDATATYYAPQLDLGHVPARPSATEVEHAREFVFHDVLGDFPWVDKGDLANYVALLITPILRPHLSGALSPLGAITAATQGTGKTLLAGDIPQALYGITSRPWVGDEAEVRKSVSTVLVASTKPVVLFDNVPEGEPVKSAMLAKLLTSQQWDDRELGANAAVEGINDRLWLATGNAMAFGGDMPSRTVLVRLDANMARPELRSGFKIPDLQKWLTEPANAAELLRALLILIMDWVGADRGEPRPYVMRQFGRWATACGDFLAHHGVPLFLDNLAALDASNEDAAEWLPFVEEWRKHFGSELKTANEVAKTAERSWTPETGEYDPWQGRYLVDGRGKPRNVVSLGRQLRAHKGKIFATGTTGGYKIDSPDKLERDNVRRYRIVIVGPDGLIEEEAAPAAAEPEAEPAPRQYQPSLYDVDDGHDGPPDD